MNTSDEWVKVPPRAANESPEEIRRQRDLYRDLVDCWLKEKWKDAQPGDWSSSDGCNSEIQSIIAELEAGRARG